MRSDAVLPANVVPEGVTEDPGHALLVTGATGFLGRYVVRELLQRPGAAVVCLVRAVDVATARERLLVSLKAAHVDVTLHAARIQVLAGAVDQPLLGLPALEYHKLSRQIGTIFHCAANVNWTRSYRRLRDSNVIGTLGLIRLACTGPLKRIYFSSTIGVCFATPGPEQVDESTDMLPYVDQMPLPYAQSKCVAESLLRAAADRGVPVSVIRPALISGDSLTGEANQDDLICALIQGCVASGSAIDSDWQLDCVPVDYVARVLATLTDSGRPHWEVLNLFHERGRDWREIVLWMNLYGYPVQLVSHAEWLRRTFDRATAPPSLFGYRRFFGAERKRFAAPAPYETYLELAQGRVRNDLTRQVLGALDLKTPPLDAALIERYLEHYVETGKVPRSHRRRTPGSRRGTAYAKLEQTIGKHLAECKLTLLNVREQPFESRNGIFNEIASARLGGQVGIRRYEVLVRELGKPQSQTLSVLLKSKPADTVMQDLLVEVATLCDPSLGAHCEAFKSDLGLAGCHERELALYELPEPRLRRLMPAAFGTHRDPLGGSWSVAMEYLSDAEGVDVAAMATAWTSRQLGAAIRGLADVHAIWYQRHTELRAMPWLVSQPEAARMVEMVPLWNALADHSSPFFSPWIGQPIRPLQKALIASLNDWWPALRAQPQTLVHNDFNPRNFLLRESANGLSLSIFDWELATVDVPQRDLAELLCFVLPPGCSRRMLADYLELSRSALQSAACVPIDRDLWLQGFVLSLRHLMIHRLPLYTLMHRFRRQAFLPHVIRTWAKLYQFSSELRLTSRQHPRDQTSAHDEKGGAKQVLGPDAQQTADV